MCVSPGWARAQDSLAGVIYIPAINLDEPIYIIAPVIDNVYDEFDQYVIGDGVQWLSDTAWIATSGRVVLAGHTPGVFEHLERLVIGDQIVIYDSRDVASYIVTGIFRAKPSEYQWLRESSEDKLLVITCDGDQRLLIEAFREDTNHAR